MTLANWFARSLGFVSPYTFFRLAVQSPDYLPFSFFCSLSFLTRVYLSVSGEFSLVVQEPNKTSFSFATENCIRYQILMF